MLLEEGDYLLRGGLRVIAELIEFVQLQVARLRQMTAVVGVLAPQSDLVDVDFMRALQLRHFADLREVIDRRLECT